MGRRALLGNAGRGSDIMTILTINWSTVWLMTGLGIGTVFCILILLVLVLQIFTAVAPKTTSKIKAGAVAVKEKIAEDEIAQNSEHAAVATAVYLYLQSQHDEESGTLTIHHTDHPAWHSELNQHL